MISKMTTTITRKMTSNQTPRRSLFIRLTSIPILMATALLLVRCGGSSHHNPIAGSGANVQPISVNSGAAGNYANGVFTSVTVCVPSTSTCQTITDVLVDTASFGLRLLATSGGGQLNIALPQQTASGNTIGECAEFASGFTWGPVAMADVQMSGETAANMPVEIIDPTFASVPAHCQSFGVPEQDSLQTLRTNGILGVGPFIQDCGQGCALPGNDPQNPGLYYSCAGNSCSVASEAVAQQVANPVAAFTTDNNGVIVELPSVSSPTASISGSLVFGIGTQSNNGLSSATVFPLNSNGDFTTTFQGQPFPGFTDSGSNGLFFLDSATVTSLPTCADNPSFYCPNSTASLSATITSGSSTGAVKFSVQNADTLFSNQSAFVFPGLAGPNPGVFDWGLPFFFGRNVFTAIESKSTPGGTGPYWAF